MTQTKKCSKCKETKSLDLFQTAKASKDGKYSICRECRNADQRKIKPVGVGINIGLCHLFLGVNSSRINNGHYI